MGPALPVDLWISSTFDTFVPLTSSVSFLHWDRAALFAKRSVEKKKLNKACDDCRFLRFVLAGGPLRNRRWGGYVTMGAAFSHAYSTSVGWGQVKWAGILSFKAGQACADRHVLSDHAVMLCQLFMAMWLRDPQQ